MPGTLTQPELISLSDLQDALATRFPAAEIQSDQADAPNGWRMLHLWCNDMQVGVQWRPGDAFGLSAWTSGTDTFDRLYEPPNEWYSQAEAAYHRIVSLLLDRKSTSHPSATIAEVRLDRGLSQESLSEQLSVRQGTYSKLERRDDVKVSSLRKVIESMGGRLIIQAVFPDTREVREIKFERDIVQK